LPQSALAGSDDSIASSAWFMIRWHGRMVPGAVAAYFTRQNASGCSARVVSGVQAAICETVVPAICGDDVTAIRAKDMQLRFSWPGWLPRPGAAQRQRMPADNH
jgi:hypothetical protein